MLFRSILDTVRRDLPVGRTRELLEADLELAAGERAARRALRRHTGLSEECLHALVRRVGGRWGGHVPRVCCLAALRGAQGPAEAQAAGAAAEAAAEAEGVVEATEEAVEAEEVAEATEEAAEATEITEAVETMRDFTAGIEADRKSTRLNSSHT